MNEDSGRPLSEPVLGQDVGSLDLPPIGGNYDPSRTRESMRGVLAIILLATLVIVVAVSMLIVWFKPDNSAALGEVLKFLLAPLVGLVGAATGFYYGSNQPRQPN